MLFKTLAVRLTGLAACTLFLIALAGCGIVYTAKTAPFGAGPVSITSFTASPSGITAGEPVTLSWAVSEAKSVSLDNGIGTVTGTSITVTPASTVTYTLTATGATGTAAKAVTVRVANRAVISSFTADPGVLTPATTGVTSVTLRWDVAGSISTSIDNGVGIVTGNTAVVSPSATTTYNLTAMNAMGQIATATATVKVRNSLANLTGTSYGGTNRSNYLVSEGLCEFPNQLAMDAAGNIYATDREDQAICRIAPDGTVTILASNVDAVSSPSSQKAAFRLRATGNGAAHTSAITATAAATESRAKSAAQLTPEERAAIAVGPGLEDAWIAPAGIAVTPDGSTVYVSDQNTSTIRRIILSADGTANISVAAGGVVGYADGPGASAQFNRPAGLALDGMGNLYVADARNHAVRKIAFAADGSATVSTLAGNTTDGYVDGTASQAEFGGVMGVAASADGLSVYVSDAHTSNPGTASAVIQSTIRKIATAADGTVNVSTVAGSQYGFADGAGTAARFSLVIQLALSSDGTTLYVADPQNCLLRKIAMQSDGSSVVSTIAGNPGKAVHWDEKGSLASFDGPGGITLDAHGNAYIAEMWSDYYGLWYGTGGPMALRKVSLTSGQVSTLVLNTFGDTGGQANGLAKNAGYMLPSGIVADGNGNYFVADTTNGTIRKITVASDGSATATTVAGTPGRYGFADGIGAAASFDAPVGMAFSPDGKTLYIADWSNGTVRKLDVASGAVTTLAGAAGTHGYANGNGQNTLYFPRRLAVDSKGLIYVVDQALDGELRTIDPVTGSVSIFAPADATGGMFALSVPTGVATYTSADKTRSVLYISTECAVFQVDLTAATPAATLMAGSGNCGYQDGSAGNALFSEIWDIASDSQGNVYVADTQNSVVRRIAVNGAVSTVAGSYGSTTTTTGALPASIYLPLGIAVDATDNLLVTVPNAVLTLAP